MKNKILLIAAILIASVSLAQQSTTFGIKAGLSAAGLRGEAVNNLQNVLDFADGMITTSDRAGLFAGANVSIPLGEMVSIEPGLYYSQKGYQLRGDLNLKGVEFLGANARANLGMHYIDLPVLVKANLNGFQVFAGPQVSYLAQADLRLTAGVLGINLLNRKLDATGQFNRWDAGITGGIGYEFKNGISLSAAYDHGLSRVDANQSINSYNRAFKVGIGMRF